MLARPRLAPSIALCGVGAALPASALLFFGRDTVDASSHLHFATVGGSALVAALASIALTVYGARRRDGRTVLVGTAFSAMAGMLLLHGIASPGVIVGMNGVVALSGALTLPLGAAVLALSGFAPFRGQRAIAPLVVLQAAVILGLLALGLAGLLDPGLVPAVPEVGSPAALALVTATLVLFGFLILRSLDTYVLTQRLSDAAVVVGLAFLAAALVGALDYEYFELGWWLGHGFEIVGLVLVGAAVVLDIRRADQSRPLTGGLPAARLVAAEETFLGTRVRALTVRLAEKDGSTEEHTRRVALRAVQIGETLGLPPSRLRSLATGGLLHDIGKLAVPDEILKKPGSLTDEEFGVIQRHPEWGHHLLGELGDFAADVRRLVLDHHERLDGSGYPRGLTQAQLDLETRILAVCDVYDALISPRVYRDAWTEERALGLLRDGAGELFDPRCVAALQHVLAAEREPLDVAV
jgi:HD-GYP domain-containing protein (c-di-GMP phosphodiesterase class II)